jgi:carboxylesterase
LSRHEYLAVTSIINHQHNSRRSHPGLEQLAYRLAPNQKDLNSIIYAFQYKISKRLLVWSSLSILAGAVLSAAGYPFWRSFGIQAIIWGLLESMVGMVTLLRSRRKSKQPSTPEQDEREAIQVERFLWMNAGLAALVLLASFSLLLTLGSSSPSWKGSAWGLMAHGGFLLTFYWQHALKIPSGKPTGQLKVLPEAKHEQYLLDGGPLAALLVHGFPGTPNDTRALGEVLQRAGWTVQGLLVPGFGPQLESLGEKTYEEWIAAVVEALRNLRANHGPVLLVGFSFGGALAIKAAQLEPPDGLVLLSPFLWPDAYWQRLLIPLIPFILPGSVHPFQWINFNNPLARRRLKHMIKQIDVENPQTIQALKQLRVHLSTLTELRRAGVEAANLLEESTLPTLFLQGRQDQVLNVKRTRQLLTRFPTPPEYIELDASHYLVDPQEAAWPEVKQAVLAFAHNFEENQRQV